MTPHEGQTIRVLVVEPDPACRKTLTDELSRRGFVVQGFDDGASLLGDPDAAADADVVLSAWGMPRMSGLELSTRLRQRGVAAAVVLLASPVLQAREPVVCDPEAGDFIGVEALVGHLGSMAQASRRRMAMPPSEHGAVISRSLMFGASLR